MTSLFLNSGRQERFRGFDPRAEIRRCLQPIPELATPRARFFCGVELLHELQEAVLQFCHAHVFRRDVDVEKKCK